MKIKNLPYFVILQFTLTKNTSAAASALYEISHKGVVERLI